VKIHFGEDANAHREEESEVRCRACGRRFRTPRWYAKRGVRLHFCSRECRVTWEDEQDHADAPYRLQLPGRPEYRGGNWEVQAGKARERDGYLCRVCGITEEEIGRQLDVHHWMPARTFGSPADANNLENLVSVCPTCHKRLEDEGRSALPLFDHVAHPGQREDMDEAP
jgi:5-methylcytosine-specific restriction endonuclease McrA